MNQIAQQCLYRSSHFSPGLATNYIRKFSISQNLYGQKNFRKFNLGNKRGTRIFKEMRNAGAFPDIPVETQVKPTGYKYGDRYVTVPEMIPEFIVPDLTGCQLKPYVSYRAQDVYQTEFTPEDLFDAVYKGKIEHDLAVGKVDAEGNPLEPSEGEKLTAEEAFIAARKVGNDIFSERIPKHWECLDIPLVTKRKPRNEYE